MEFVLLLLRVNKEDGLPLKAEEFVLHVHVNDKLPSVQEDLSSSSTQRSHQGVCTPSRCQGVPPPPPCRG